MIKEHKVLFNLLTSVEGVLLIISFLILTKVILVDMWFKKDDEK
jgi:hypothetical protein